MEKLGSKTRDIKFYSKKNQTMVMVHSKEARAYTKYLESMEQVASYVAGKALDAERLQMVPRVDIRGEYFETQWQTDFYLIFADGTVGIRELAAAGDLTKRAAVEKLELSRRYWSAAGVTNWKIVWMGGNEGVR